MSKKRLIITSLISIILVSILFIGTTYSIFTTEDVDENANVYTTGNLDITYTLSDNNVKLTDNNPTSPELSGCIKPYRITVNNNGNVAYKFNLILNNTTATTSIDPKYIMTRVGILDPIELANCTDNIIKSDIVVAANNSVDIDVIVFIKDTVPNTEIGKSFAATLTIDGFAVSNNTKINNSNLISSCGENYNYIKSLYNDGSEINTVHIGDNESNPTVNLNQNKKIMLDNNGDYRYYGASPNNYITFNDELWRIISVSNVEGENGISSKRMKIIRNESIGTFSYDNKIEGLGTSNSSFGSNDWTDSRLMMLLNPGYETINSTYSYEGSLYWNSKNGTCYAGDNQGTKPCDFTSNSNTKGLTTSAKNMIDKAKFYLGGNSTLENLYVNDLYNMERGLWSEGFKIYNKNNTEWLGYVGLMYPSDYSYATDLSICKENVSNYNTNECYSNNWLYINSTPEWLVSPLSSTSNTAFNTHQPENSYVSKAQLVRPVLYLSSNVSIASGEGTYSNPYQLFSFEINNGNTYTNNSTVTLSFTNNSNISTICISNTTSCTNFVNFNNNMNWTLSSGEGEKTIYIICKDKNNNVIYTGSKSIIFDKSAPTNNIVNINSLNKNIANLSISSTGANYMCLKDNNNSSNCNWINYSTNYNYNLGNTNGNKMIYAFFKDYAGNISSTTINHNCTTCSPKISY